MEAILTTKAQRRKEGKELSSRERISFSFFYKLTSYAVLFSYMVMAAGLF